MSEHQKKKRKKLERNAIRLILGAENNKHNEVYYLDDVGLLAGVCKTLNSAIYGDYKESHTGEIKLPETDKGTLDNVLAWIKDPVYAMKSNMEVTLQVLPFFAMYGNLQAVEMCDIKLAKYAGKLYGQSKQNEDSTCISANDELESITFAETALGDTPDIDKIVGMAVLAETHNLNRCKIVTDPGIREFVQSRGIMLNQDDVSSMRTLFVKGAPLDFHVLDGEDPLTELFVHTFLDRARKRDSALGTRELKIWSSQCTTEKIYHLNYDDQRNNSSFPVWVNHDTQGPFGVRGYTTQVTRKHGWSGNWVIQKLGANGTVVTHESPVSSNKELPPVKPWVELELVEGPLIAKEIVEVWTIMKGKGWQCRCFGNKEDYENCIEYGCECMCEMCHCQRYTLKCPCRRCN